MKKVVGFGGAGGRGWKWSEGEEETINLKHHLCNLFFLYLLGK